MRRTVLLAVAVTVLVVLVAASSYAAPRDFGTVKLAGKDKNTILEFELPDKIKVTVTTKGVKFPVGTYAPKAFTLMKRDKSGKIWKATCRGKLGSLSNFTVSKGDTVTLEPSTEFVVKGYIYRMRRARDGGKIIPIGLVIQGKSGEFFAPGVRTGNRRVPAALFQIIGEDEKVIAQGKFEYG